MEYERFKLLCVPMLIDTNLISVLGRRFGRIFERISVMIVREIFKEHGLKLRKTSTKTKEKLADWRLLKLQLLLFAFICKDFILRKL